MLYFIIVILLAGAWLSVITKKLTTAGAASGAVIGFLLYQSTGLTGICMMTAFFIMAVLATRWKSGIKVQQQFTRDVKGLRTAAQVWANAGAAALFSLVYILYNDPCWAIVVAACFASATADTLSSELGNVYGSRFYTITNFRAGIKGNNGIVSKEGTLIGLLGAAVIAVVYCMGYEWNINFFIIVLAGVFGNYIDSVLGATLENKGIIGNNLVNFFNTLSAAAFAILCACIL